MPHAWEYTGYEVPGAGSFLGQEEIRLGKSGQDVVADIHEPGRCIGPVRGVKPNRRRDRHEASGPGHS